MAVSAYRYNSGVTDCENWRTTFSCKNEEGSYFKRISDASLKVDKLVKFLIAALCLAAQITITIKTNSLAVEKLKQFAKNFELIRMGTSIFALINGLAKTYESGKTAARGKNTAFNTAKAATGIGDVLRVICSFNGFLGTIGAGSAELSAITPAVFLARHTAKFMEIPLGKYQNDGEFGQVKNKHARTGEPEYVHESKSVISASIMVATIELFLAIVKVGKFSLGPSAVSVLVISGLGTVAAGTSLGLDITKDCKRKYTPIVGSVSAASAA